VRAHRDGHWLRYGPSRRFASPEVRNVGGDRVPCRVPQRGGNEGVWTDVRPRRRKAMRHVFRGQDRFQEEKRHQNWDGYKLRQDRVT